MRKKWTFKAARLFTVPPNVHGYLVWWGYFIPFVVVPAMMGWLSSTMPWFWHWFRWFGVASVALITATFVMALIAAYRVWRTHGSGRSEENADPVRNSRLAPHLDTDCREVQFADVSIRWAIERGTNQQRVCVHMTPQKRLRDAAIIARYATQMSNSVSPHWEWSASRRIVETRDAVAGETIEAEIFCRSRLTSPNDSDVIHIFGDVVIIGTADDPLLGKLLRVEVQVAAGDDVILKSACFSFHRYENRQSAHMLDLSWLDVTEKSDLARTRFALLTPPPPTGTVKGIT